MVTLASLYAHCRCEGEHMIWTGHYSTSSVPQVSLDGGRHYIAARRAVLEACGEMAPGPNMVAFPVCRMRLCIRREHLEWKSRGDVCRIARVEGRVDEEARRRAIAEGKRRSGTAKLTPEAVADIKAAPSGAEAARRWGINKSMANRIRRGDAWRDVAPVEVQRLPHQLDQARAAPIERAITGDYLLRRQGVEVPSRFPAEFWRR